MSVSVSSIELHAFRNLKDGRVDLHPQSTVVFGLNGAGKTNLLEAICLAAAGYSPRTRSPSDFPRHGASEMTVCAQLDSDAILAATATATIRDRRLTHRLLPPIVVPIAFFSPDDLLLVKGGPSYRRRYLDQILFQLSPTYRHNWKRYRAALTQRNALLKAVRSRRSQVSELMPWTRQLIDSGSRIARERHALSLRLHQRVVSLSDGIVDARTASALSYAPCCPGHQTDHPDALQYWNEALARAFEHVLSDDIASGTTTVGAHRDDLTILLSELPARDFASQGQQRTLALCLRMAQLNELEDAAGERGIVLLDDVASELDSVRRGRLTLITSERQAVITVTEPALVPPANLVLSVSEGKVTLA